MACKEAPKCLLQCIIVTWLNTRKGLMRDLFWLLASEMGKNMMGQSNSPYCNKEAERQRDVTSCCLLFPLYFIQSPSLWCVQPMFSMVFPLWSSLEKLSHILEGWALLTSKCFSGQSGWWSRITITPSNQWKEGRREGGTKKERNIERNKERKEKFKIQNKERIFKSLVAECKISIQNQLQGQQDVLSGKMSPSLITWMWSLQPLLAAVKVLLLKIPLVLSNMEKLSWHPTKSFTPTDQHSWC